MIERNTSANGAVRLRVSGELSCITAVSFRHVVDDSVGQGVTIVIDLGSVERIDAEGVSALVGTVRRARSVEGEARIGQRPTRSRSHLSTRRRLRLADRIEHHH